MPTPADAARPPFPPPGGAELVEHVNAGCRGLLERKRAEVAAIDAEAAPLVDALLELTSGGKKMRPLLGWLGWRAAAADPEPAAAAAHPAVVSLGVALELFQAAALVHDDIIDRSATRRGAPSTHKRFEQLHSAQRFAGDPEHFGTAGGILSGDLALAWASEAFEQAIAAAPGAAAETTVIFRRMHTEVIAGQYLDVLAEVDLRTADEQALARARRIAVYKSAKYSVEYPVLLGAALHGGQAGLLTALSETTLPLGEAFQLHDDLLGVFGDPAATGKPVGDDLREGKRTALVLTGLQAASAQDAACLRAVLGDPRLTEEDIVEAQRILSSGTPSAVAQVEQMIRELGLGFNQSLGRLPGAGVSAPVADDLKSLAHSLVPQFRADFDTLKQ
ncbi:polyprenyl synthetase family protein [Nesterenkonia alkaliphila]|nr:polyprenyl synthetase family protein [Nesterenkonia alkaliphila]GFZ83951.1 geranylgeranyl pyrophosphate synthase [Nesterenkonia alkaliphila]